MMPSLGIETRAIHAGQDADPITGAVTVPIYQSSTFKQDGVGGLRNGYEYGRSGNPTRAALETCIASLEQGAAAFAFSSGLAAEDCVIRSMCGPGDRVLIPSDAYGGTVRLFNRVAARWGLDVATVDVTNLDAVEAALTAQTRLVWCETPTNPRLSVADIRSLADMVHSVGSLLVVDNTFASPYLQAPLTLGADIVVHSTTKYIAGHSDVIGGAVVTADQTIATELQFNQMAVGAVPGPLDVWLILRGIKTLPVRMERHCDNAEAVARFLTEHSRVVEVNYPGLESHPAYELARKQMRRPGGMVSFRIAGGQPAAESVCAKANLFTLAESLGGVESLIEYPSEMTHAVLKGTSQAVPDNLIRLSVGLENLDDLLNELEDILA